MGHKVLINGTSREITGGKVMVSGTVRDIKHGKTMINGTGYDISFVTGTPISDLAVGSSVYMAVNGTRKEFLLVHKGLPGSMYDASCNGNWLLMKDIYERREWNVSATGNIYNGRNDYANSTIHSYLNGTFLGLFDAGIKSQIKQVKIPYRPGSGYGKTVNSGANGLSTKIFLLSAAELSFNFSDMPTREGAELRFFQGCADNGADAKRVAMFDGSAGTWWLRSPFCAASTSDITAMNIKDDGDVYQGVGFVYWGGGVRPALILPNEATVDDNYNVIGLE